jgi:hypothetical protein
VKALAGGRVGDGARCKATRRPVDGGSIPGSLNVLDEAAVQRGEADFHDAPMVQGISQLSEQSVEARM